jgi:tetratricopeptide (TPR) repeat protein
VSTRVHSLAVLIACATALPAADWSLARSPHFEVYAQAGPEDARSVLLWFEQLHSFFLRQTGVPLDNRPPLRIVVFRSAPEYEPYRIGPTADAYYVATESRDYIVMAHRGAGDFQVAAHEYWHFVEHAGTLQLPPWLNEGLAEFFSTVRLGESASLAGGEPAGRSRILRSRPWMPLAELLALPADSPRRDDRETSDLFYAESWALADMLILAPEYTPRFHELAATLAAGEPGPEAFARIYAKPLEAIAGDLRNWIEKRKFTPLTLSTGFPEAVPIEVSDISSRTSRYLIAEVLLATGKVERAETLYRELAQEKPNDTDVAAALALVALRRDDPEGARRQWTRALAEGIHDPEVCYRYAITAQDAGFSAEDVRPALERAVTLRPAFDDALYTLALLENNTSRPEAALRHLRAMHTITAGRQFQYWVATAYALTELGRREEAKAAAETAAAKAATSEERAYAIQLGVIAVTDLVVQFTRDAAGNMRLVTTRAPHDAPEWNPFIEPGDRIRRVEARLRDIDCSGGATTFTLDTDAGPVRLTIPDPHHVQMRNAPPEFTCGAQQPMPPVTAVYAASRAANADGILRGLAFQ